MAYDRMRFERIIIYKLKRQYGHRIEIYKVNSATVNPATGLKSINKSVFPIYLAIPLPYEEIRKYQYDHSYIAADKQFTQGAFYDPKTRVILVDKADIPSTLNLTIDDYLVMDGQRYNMQKIGETNGKHAYVLTVKAVEGQNPGQVFELEIFHNLRLTERVGV